MSSHGDRLYVVSDAHATGFDSVITIGGQTVRPGVTDLILVER